jgi:tripartite-type tricarboxylate transporter receptor subunit TctC
MEEALVMLTKTKLLLAASVAAIAVTPTVAQAEWPERPITAVVMYSAGGGTDTVLRALSAEMAKQMDWQIDVVNKPGAVGGVATKFVLNRTSDGYTWLGAANYNKFSRVKGGAQSKSWEDWYYMQAGTSLASWSVRPDSPFKKFDDVIAEARKRPGEVTISTSGSGGLWHELAAIVAQAAGVELKYVPYKGGKPATLAGLNGEVDVAGGGVHEHIEFVRAGKLRNLQQTGPEDIKLEDGTVMPSVGNFLPQIKNDLPFSGIYNIGIRRDAPIEVIQAVQNAFVAAVNSDSFAAVVKKRKLFIDIKLGEEADRRAAFLEAVTANTFQKLNVPGAKTPEELGLPDPADFDKWWPPKGYKPLPLAGS